MRRTLFALLVAAAAACGGSPKQAATPLPPEAKAEPAPAPEKPAEPAKPAEAAKPAEPPPAPSPLDVTIASPDVSVKLISKGHGKRGVLKLSPKPGDKQPIELAMDFTGTQHAPPELGGTHEDTVPTLVLSGDAEVKDVAADGTAEYVVTVNGTDAHSATGKTIPPDQAQAEQEKVAKVKSVIASLQGMTIGGTVGANGKAGDVKLHMEKPAPMSSSALDLVRLTLPGWPVLPAEPIGVGAKWRVTTNTKFADQVQVTQTTDYQLVAHKGKTWTIKGTTKVTGADQEIPSQHAGAPSTKLSKISGKGTVDVSLVEGALYPTLKQTLSTEFTASTTPPAATDPKAPADASKPIEVTFALEQGAQITPKAPAAP